jgi:hypothetical protein
VRPLLASSTPSPAAQNANIVTQAAPGRAGLEQIVRWYLSAQHRNSSDDGYPSAALRDEIRRRTDPTKQGLQLLAVSLRFPA